MWRNVFSLAFRLMAKHRLFFLINIAGLALGLMAVVLIVAYVRIEQSYDSWVPGGERVWKLGYYSAKATGAPFESNNSPGPVVPALLAGIDGLEAASRSLPSRERYRVGDDLFDAQVLLTDAAFFDIFPSPVIAGDPKVAIQDPNRIILTRSAAETYFGRTDIIGADMAIAGGMDLIVGAVIEDYPKRSHREVTHIRLLDQAQFPGNNWLFDGWQAATMHSYVKLSPTLAFDDFEAQMTAIYNANVPTDKNGFRPTLVPMQLFDIFTEGRQDVLLAMQILAAFILLIASINFINLTLSRMGVREREIAVRRVVGANRGQIMVQFLAESCFTVALALVLGLAIGELALPSFNSLMNTDLQLMLFNDPFLAIICIGLVATVGIGAGLIPAYAMASGSPSEALASGHEKNSPLISRLGPPLVVLQFALAISLITATFVLHSQTIFALTRDPGYSVANKAGVYVPRDDHPRFREMLATIPGVTSATSSFVLPGGTGQVSAAITLPNGEQTEEVAHLGTSPGFLKAYDVAPIAGRLRDSARATDWTIIPQEEGASLPIVSVVINDRARVRFGFASPDAAVDQIITSTMGDTPFEMRIVGVVENLSLRSTRHLPRAVIFADLPPLNQFVTLAYDDSTSFAAIREAVKTIWDRELPSETLIVRDVEQYASRHYVTDQRQVTLFAVFSGLAIIIAMMGLYGMSAFNAERRTKEIGVRKVLGAGINDIVRLFVWQFSKPVFIANLIAWPLAWWFLDDWLSQFVERVDLTIFPFVVAGIAALLLSAATIAVQAVRVARANPIKALRTE